MKYRLFRLFCTAYYRRLTHTARLDSRRMEGWCDYKPAHRKVEWHAAVNGRPFGQACFKHLGALMVDASRAGGTMTLSYDDPKEVQR